MGIISIPPYYLKDGLAIDITLEGRTVNRHCIELLIILIKGSPTSLVSATMGDSW